MNYDLTAFGIGAYKFVLAFALACLFIALFKRIYQMITPYNEQALIEANNHAAAITLGGAIIGFALPVASALEQTGSTLEFAMWAVLAGVIQIVAFVFMRKFVVSDMTAKIEAGNTAAAIYLAATSIAVGLLNAASMTY
jgi:putative membrane protein